MKTTGPIAWMALNPVAANLLMLMILVAGLLGMTRIKQEVFPEFELDMVLISVVYPGASPEEVEQGIVLAIEEAVRGVDGIKRVGGSSNEGVGTVWAELLIETDRDQAIADIKSEVDRIQSFPEQAERPKVTVFKQPRKVLSVMLSGEVPISTLHNTAEQLRAQLLASPDVTRIDIDGIPPREVSIEIPRETLEGLGLTLNQIGMQIRAASLELPGGEVETKGGEILLRLADRRQGAEQYKDIVIRSTVDGAQVRLGDIATVNDGYVDNDRRTLYNGLPAAQLSVFRVGSETPQGVATAVREISADFQRTLPDTIRVDYWNDQSQLLQARIDLLVRNGRMGLILVVAILALFLNVRLAFWVSLGIPISFLGSFLLMPGMDITVNMISLFSLIVTLGMVVDDAIVVGEAAYSKMEKGMDKLQAAISGAQQMAVPVTFAILTTIAAFGPMFFVPGFSGKLFRIMPAVIVSVLIFSLIESFFILPAHLAHLKERGKGKGLLNRMEEQFDKPRLFMSGKLQGFIDGRYTRVLEKTTDNRYVTFAIAMAALIFTIGLVGGRFISTSFLPNIEGELVSASARLPYGSPTEATEKVREAIETSLEKTIEELGPNSIRGVYTTVGSPPVVEGPGPTDDRSGSHLLGVQVYLVPSDDRDFGTKEFNRVWEENTVAMAGVESMQFKDDWGPSAGAAIDLRLTHPNTDILIAAAEETEERLRSYSDLTQVESSLSEGKPRLDFQLLPAAQTLGITSRDVGMQLRSAFFGMEALREQVGRDEVKVMLRLPKDQRQSEYDIQALKMRTPTGASISLGDVARFDRTRSPSTIQREDGKRTINVRAKLAATADSAQSVTASVNAVDIPELMEKYPGLELGYSGEQREQAESFASLGKNYILALVAIYGLLAIPFRSYTQPLIIMSAIPFGIVGACLGHMLMGFNLSIISMFGIVALSGVVVNDSLVLIDSANRFRKAGATPTEAIQQAGKDRFRPILLTSLTTFFGLAPMIFETSIQAKFLVPMAISLGFGVLFVTFIVLLLVPAVYLIIEDIRNLRPASVDTHDPQLVANPATK